jgi:hypothetical protein
MNMQNIFEFKITATKTTIIITLTIITIKQALSELHVKQRPCNRNQNQFA